jgi:Zn-dependent M28 family amino/carboxypeptidase
VFLRHGPRSEVDDDGTSPFSGIRAYAHVEDLVAMGPRSIGSEAIGSARTYIIEALEGLDLAVIQDPFNATYQGRDYRMVNIIGVVPGSGEGIIAVGGHYDTKEIPGANDGGSSSGLLLEMARILRNSTLKHTVWIIFFDGEDTGDGWDTMFYGSKHMARDLKARGQAPDWLILADMIGDRKLLIKRDRNSDERLREYIWEVAGGLGYKGHFSRSTTMVLDDHVPFMEIGVPSCLLIDFEYGPLNSYWHTEKDDMDKISESSLKIVGDVIYRAVIGLDGGELDG